MLQLKINCESITDARMYLNAQQYLNLISDFAEALRTAKKHGDDTAVLKVVDTFMPHLFDAANNEGPY